MQPDLDERPGVLGRLVLDPHRPRPVALPLGVCGKPRGVRWLVQHLVIVPAATGPIVLDNLGKPAARRGHYGNEQVTDIRAL